MSDCIWRVGGPKCNCAIAEARCPLQVLTLQYSGDSNFNPSTSGQNGSPGGPTLLVVSLMPPLQSVTLQSCSAKRYGVRLPHSDFPASDTQLQSACR